MLAVIVLFDPFGGERDLLKGRRATTHWLTMDQLGGLGTVPGLRAGRDGRQPRFASAAGVVTIPAGHRVHSRRPEHFLAAAVPFLTA